MIQVLFRIRNGIEGRERALAYAIACLVVLACWVAIVISGERIKSFDETAFIDLATTLFDTGQYLKDGELTAFRAPGLVFFLTPFAGLGFDIVGLRMVNAVLVGLGLILIFHMTERRAGPLAGLVAVAMIPLWPVVIYTGTTLYPQTLAAFLLVLTVFFLDRVGDSRALWPVILGGLAYGALMYTIPIVLLLLPVFALWILWQARYKITSLLIFVAVTVALIAPWSYRNYVVFDKFIIVATSSGYNLLAGNAPDARYNTSLNVRFPEYVYTELTGAGEIEASDIMTRAAIKEIVENPGKTARLYVGKFLHWFDFSNTLLTDKRVEGGASSLAPSMRDMILLVTYSTIIALPLIAHILHARRYPFQRSELLFLALWVVSGLAYAIFFTRVRFRIPFDWLIITSNAMYLAAVFEAWMDRKEKLRG